jgi:hypothetical protein
MFIINFVFTQKIQLYIKMRIFTITVLLCNTLKCFSRTLCYYNVILFSVTIFTPNILQNITKQARTKGEIYTTLEMPENY